MENKVLKPGKLLTSDGTPVAFGYNFKPVVSTNKESARPRLRYKEWDFYQLTGEKSVLQVTYGHVSYAGAINLVLFNYRGEKQEMTIPLVFPMDSLNLVPSAGDFCHYVKEAGKIRLEITVEPGKRVIKAVSNAKKSPGEVNITLTYPKDDDGILVVTPFEKPNQFYHNYKQCCMKAEGFARIGNLQENFDGVYALIDWGRGVLPYTHKWWWSNGSGEINGLRFGFNIGVFGDNCNATENTIFYDGVAHKLGNITYTRPDDFISGDWEFVSDDGRFTCVMSPFYDNFTELNFLIAHNRCHQVFGKFNGAVKLDDGTTLKLNNLTAFIEEAQNRW